MSDYGVVGGSSPGEPVTNPSELKSRLAGLPDKVVLLPACPATASIGCQTPNLGFRTHALARDFPFSPADYVTCTFSVRPRSRRARPQRATLQRGPSTWTRDALGDGKGCRPSSVPAENRTQSQRHTPKDATRSAQGVFAPPSCLANTALRIAIHNLRVTGCSLRTTNHAKLLDTPCRVDLRVTH